MQILSGICSPAYWEEVEVGLFTVTVLESSLWRPSAYFTLILPYTGKLITTPSP